jgi:hypothetical protein
MIDRTEVSGDKGSIAAEFANWRRLFSKKYIDRVMVGITMMFFQRESVYTTLRHYQI